MRRRAFLAALGAGTIATAGCLGGTADAPGPGGNTTTTDPGTTAPTVHIVNESFEDGLTGWTVGKDLPAQLGPDGAAAGTSTQLAADGETALELTLDGSHDDGTVWVQQHADLSTVSTLKVDAYSPESSFNEITQLATFTGPTKELEEIDFDRSEQVRDHSGWKTYEYPVDHEGEGLVAVGINIVWETTATRFLDHVRLDRD